MSFVKRFQASLESLTVPAENTAYVVAYSGGLDSQVLLYCCKALKLPLRAVHVHHGLQNRADDWVLHCQATCNDLNVPLDIIYVDAKKKPGQSPEESARIVRYQALQENLKESECLLTAQHLDDQAETLLLQLFRTAGTAGLSAMPAHRQFGQYRHLRPLLSFSRKEIEAFAAAHALQWVEDPSNQDVSYDRNFIRKNILTSLKQRWPEVAEQLSTVARLQSKNLQVLEDMAAIDLANVLRPTGSQRTGSRYRVVSLLSNTELKRLSSARLLNVLRYWIKDTLKNEAMDDWPLQNVLSRNLLESIEKTLVCSRQDATPVVVINTYELRRYQDRLYLLQPRLLQPQLLQTQPAMKQSEMSQSIDWRPSSALVLSAINSRILPQINIAGGLNKRLLTEVLKISYRKGGEYFHPAGRQHSQRLKKLLQEENIPPWDRDSVPLLYYNDELIAVIGLWLAKDYVVADDEAGWGIELELL